MGNGICLFSDGLPKAQPKKRSKQPVAIDMTISRQGSTPAAL